MTWDDSDWETVSFRITGRDRFVLTQLAEEGYFESVSDAVRTSIDGLTGTEQPVDEEQASRMSELKDFYDAASSLKVAEFLAETSHLVDRFAEFAEEHNEDWWQEDISEYAENYFETGEILSYHEQSDEKNKEFLDETVALIADFGEMAEFYGDKNVFDEVDSYFAEFFAESRAEDKPYLKFKL